MLNSAINVYYVYINMEYTLIQPSINCVIHFYKRINMICLVVNCERKKEKNETKIVAYLSLLCCCMHFAQTNTGNPTVDTFDIP